MKLQILNKKGVDIHEGMMGLFFEDINYGADGGLYAEMIENRSFEFLRATGVNNAYTQEYDGGYGWSKYPENCPFAAMEYHTTSPLTEENPHYLHFRSMRPECGFTNKAYDGIFLKKGERYRIRFYANTLNYHGLLKIRVLKEGDSFLGADVALGGQTTGSYSAESVSHELADVTVTDCHDGWKRYELVLTAQATVRAASFVMLLAGAGEVEFDCISMMPESAVCGVFRKDLAELLKSLKPGFLRFPGGCIIEGNDLNNRYQWKKSVGDITKRKANWNRWSVHGNGKENNYTGKYTHYNQTLGIGYYEYFLLCEYLGAKALPVVNVGLACQYQSDELVQVEDPRFQEFIEDALDLIEFANGGTDTTWGALRAEMGHPAPFGLELIGIGNEQWETERVDFFRRYTLFEEAIHAKYPDIKLIGSAGPDVHTERYEAAWNFYHIAAKEKADFTYAVDEHYYMPPEWFLANTHFYDEYPRDVKVFSGEYAAHPKRTGGVRSGNTLEGALSEAAFLTGVERNADVVIMASYAPLLARVGYVQWAPDMIWFDSETAYGTPSYYVQKMYSLNMGSYTLPIEAELPDKVYASASYDVKSEEVILKLVNASAESLTFTPEIEGVSIETAVVTSLGGDDIYAYNTIETPKKVAEQETVLNAEECRNIVLPAHTFAVYRFLKK
ncbi:MAG: alpha-L-arabinofuranosidase C-terminal domain-containing protein [Lachnospiraceae bacterium]